MSSIEEELESKPLEKVITSLYESVRFEREFYLVDSLDLAKKLLGKILVFKKKRYRIVEVEAYRGANDKGAHTYNNRRTQRTEAMYLEGGHVYIYMIYGMYYNINVVANVKDNPQGVLLRGIEPLDYEEQKPSTNGPGKLCRHLGIDKSHYGTDLTLSEDMYIIDDDYEFEVVESKRVNIHYAGEDKDRLWRFYISGSKYVSKK